MSVSVSLWVCALTVLASCVHVMHAACPHLPTPGRTLRRWSDSSSWPEQQKPTANEAVTIADDVLLDVSPPELASLTVEAGGSLVFSPEGDFTLATKYLMLYGALHIGSEDCRYRRNARILLTGKRGEYNITGYGEKFVGVASGATLELHGMNKLSWAKLTSTIPKLTADTGLLYDKYPDNTMSNSNRGFVSYVINGTSGETIFSKSVTFMGSSYRISIEPPALIKALESVGEGDVIVLAVQWNAISDEYGLGEVYDAIEKALYGRVTNTAKVRQLKEYEAWALIAVKGEFIKEELTTRLDPDNNKVASVTAIVSVAGESRVIKAVSKTRPIRYQGGRTDVRMTTIDAGASIVTLTSDATTWVPGDKVLITSTDFDWKQAEEGEIAYCSPEKCAPNQVRLLFVNDFMHYGEVSDGVDERAEVALLNRNIVIEGQVQDACADENGNCDVYGMDTFGGHIRIENGFASVHIEGVSLRNMGQGMYMDTHPIFFRQCGDVDDADTYSNPTYVRSISITNSYSNCVALSGTHGLIIEDNVAYDHFSHCIFLKEGGETRTVIDGNLVAGTRERFDAYNLDRQAASYLITSPKTYFRNNVAAGGHRHGVWYLFPTAPILESADKNISQPEEARHTPYLEFNNNAVHSYGIQGLYIEQKLSDDGMYPYSANFYNPKVDPLDKDSENAPTIINRLTAYKNRHRNAWIRGGHIVVQDSSFADSITSLMFLRTHAEQYLESSVIVGETANIGEPTLWWDAEDRVLHTMQRAFPFPWDLRHPVKGFESRDGPHYLDRVWFNHFTINDNRTASAFSFPGDFAHSTSAVNEVSGLNFGFEDNGDSLRVYQGNSSNYRYGDQDGDMQMMIRDKDGSLTGVAGSTVVRNYPVFTTSQCVFRSNWNMAVCPYRYGKLQVSANEVQGGKSKPVLTRDDVDPALGQEVPFKYYTRYPVILGGSHSYILHWPEYMPSTVNFNGQGFEKDYGLRFGMCVPRDAELELWSHEPQWRPSIARWKQVDSVSKLDNDNDEGDRYFWDKANGIIFFKMVNYRTRCEDFKAECKDGCPYIRVTLVSGNASDSDCRDRISAYQRDPVASSGASAATTLPATPLPEDVGAGELVPFETRPSVNGGQGQWTSWGPCTTTCGGGSQIRTRPCDNPMPQGEGSSCDGARQESRVCGTTPCEIDGRLSQWSDWSSCQTLDNEQRGMHTRTRKCNDPTPQYNGIACTGVVEQMQECFLQA